MHTINIRTPTLWAWQRQWKILAQRSIERASTVGQWEWAFAVSHLSARWRRSRSVVSVAISPTRLRFPSPLLPLPRSLQRISTVCDKCKVVTYCSRECQVADWKAHVSLARQSGRREEFLPLSLFSSLSFLVVSVDHRNVRRTSSSSPPVPRNPNAPPSENSGKAMAPPGVLSMQGWNTT